MAIVTGLSGNEIYCLRLKNLSPGELLVGNSVNSMGFLGSIGAGLRNIVGGEVSQVTQIIHEGRQQAFGRMLGEAQNSGGVGITGVTSELRHFHGNIEFLSIGSAVHAQGQTERATGPQFSTAHDAQELYCMLDAGYSPRHFVFGNVAYSIGVAGGLLGSLKSMGRGEVKEFSDILNHTRHLALQRVVAEAAKYGANAVLGIETSVQPFQGVHEMIMMGTACYHPKFAPTPASSGGGVPPRIEEQRRPDNWTASSPSQIVTSDLTAEETWNMAAIGYAPLKLVLGTAVCSLGVVGGIMSALKSFSRGEINELTTLIYEAREHALGLIRDEAAAIGADDVVGVKTHIHDLGNLLEFMAIGTAVKQLPGLTPESSILPPQALIRDKETWITDERGAFATLGGEK